MMKLNVVSLIIEKVGNPSVCMKKKHLDKASFVPFDEYIVVLIKMQKLEMLRMIQNE